MILSQGFPRLPENEFPDDIRLEKNNPTLSVRWIFFHVSEAGNILLGRRILRPPAKVRGFHIQDVEIGKACQYGSTMYHFMYHLGYVEVKILGENG